MPLFICPICGKPLKQEERAYCCPNRHNFDRAKSGYVNLLPIKGKHSKVPGDNKLMVAARQEFLNEGYYLPLCRRLCETVTAHLPKGKRGLTLLDAGCGEGYYTSFLHRSLKQAGIKVQMMGVDISKFALDKASKKDKDIAYAVGSIFHLPVGESCCDLLLNLFAPYCEEEFLRVLKPGGLMAMVIPGERHLWELKQVLYDKPYPNEVKDDTLDGFEPVDRQTVQERIQLCCQQDIDNLFKMTPYYYKTPQEGAERLLKLSELETEIAFEVLLYRKK